MRRTDIWLVVGVIASFLLLFIALFGERVAPYEPIYMVVERAGQARPYAPGEVYPLGSDVLGRDLLSLVLAGARATLFIAVLAGFARVAVGLALAVVAARWRTFSPVTDSLAEIVSAVPATLVVVLLVLTLVRGDAQVFTFVGALLVTGWAGPYRVARVELSRLHGGLFTEAALALGVGSCLRRRRRSGTGVGARRTCAGRIRRACARWPSGPTSSTTHEWGRQASRLLTGRRVWLPFAMRIPTTR